MRPARSTARSRVSPLRQVDGIPALTAEDLAARKILAILDRTEGRDFTDLRALSPRLGRAQCVGWAQQLDSGVSEHAVSPTLSHDWNDWMTMNSRAARANEPSSGRGSRTGPPNCARRPPETHHPERASRGRALDSPASNHLRRRRIPCNCRGFM